ncbi:hypothetical protein BC835DRAFT_1303953 [Cytidiella melzeri]|nr:hypothetical protein BC835DRAFT_1303953 [Cytidiella melzeri]
MQTPNIMQYLKSMRACAPTAIFGGNQTFHISFGTAAERRNGSCPEFGRRTTPEETSDVYGQKLKLSKYDRSFQASVEGDKILADASGLDQPGNKDELSVCVLLSPAHVLKYSVEQIWSPTRRSVNGCATAARSICWRTERSLEMVCHWERCADAAPNIRACSQQDAQAVMHRVSRTMKITNLEDIYTGSSYPPTDHESSQAIQLRLSGTAVGRGGGSICFSPSNDPWPDESERPRHIAVCIGQAVGRRDAAPGPIEQHGCWFRKWGPPFPATAHWISLAIDEYWIPLAFTG